MTGMQRLNVLVAMLAFLYGVWRGWPLGLALEKALIAYVAMFAAQILIILGLLRLVGGPAARGGPR
jgi:hypothetical protein